MLVTGFHECATGATGHLLQNYAPCCPILTDSIKGNPRYAPDKAINRPLPPSSRAEFLVLVLQLVKLPVNATLAEQLLVCPNFADMTQNT
ncbi:MAG TPA: hypothetical protein VGP65_16870 [Candidatus Angelobacter sp.]|nr:hypothetical protein [Candidatus Angelobacter sp.]